MNNYTTKPLESISFKDMEDKGSLSSSQYGELVIANKNCKSVKDFLSRQLETSDNGKEVGSDNYIDRSDFYFLKPKAFRSYSFIPEITSESAKPIMPNSFEKQNLKEGDLLISLDSNIGEIVILDEDYPKYMISSAIYRLPVKKEYKYYLLAFIKHPIFREQLFMCPKGSTIKHMKKEMFLQRFKIPVPNNGNAIKYIETLTQAIISKERLIKKKYQEILKNIDSELEKNQKKFEEIDDHSNFVTFNEIFDIGRLDTNLYRKEFKESDFLIKNYNNGYSTLSDLEFSLSRGQSLSRKSIGGNIHSKVYHPDFYKLMYPGYLSKYGTINVITYIGCSKKLKTLKKGDLIFGADGNNSGRSIVIIEDGENGLITNNHGIIIRHKRNNVEKTIFVKCFLDYLTDKGVRDLYAVGSNGGSLSVENLKKFIFPEFGKAEQLNIVKLYHNDEAIYKSKFWDLSNFLANDNEFNNTAGIYELDKTAKILRKKLNIAIDDMVRDKEVNISFE